MSLSIENKLTFIGTAMKLFKNCEKHTEQKKIFDLDKF